MRIVGGCFKGCVFVVFRGCNIWFILDWVCEVMFNVLVYVDWVFELEDVCVIDLFVGFGVFGFEVMLCGVGFCLFVEIEVVVCGVICDNIDVL